MIDWTMLFDLARAMVPLSLASIGGGPSIIAGLEVAAVKQAQWISSQEFVHLFAISRAAPGPGTTLGTLIGWQVAGWPGALVATLAIYLPSSMLCYLVFRLSNGHRDRRWHIALREGLAPVGTGLIIAGVISIFRVSGGGLAGLAIALVSFAILQLFPRVSALALLGFGGAMTFILYFAGFAI